MRPNSSSFFTPLLLALIFLSHSTLELRAQQQTPADKTQAETNVNAAFVGVNAHERAFTTQHQFRSPRL